MDINRKNYEAYFLDYRENNLSTEQVAELMIFLEENPELKTEFDSFESFTLHPEENITYSKKETLKKTTVTFTSNIDSDNYEEKLVADIEGDILEEERKELVAFMELNPRVKLESNLYRSTILQPDLDISYPNKESLKKKGVFVLYRTQMIYGLSIAASIIILLGFYFGFLNQPTENIRLTDLNKIEILQPDILVPEASITEIEQKNNFIVERVIIQPETKTNIIERENLAVAGMKVQSVQTINIDAENSVYEQLIETRQTPSNNFEIASNAGNTILEDPNQKKSFFKRFIAGMTNKLVDVERPKSKSFLEYTIDGYNFMTDRDVELDKELDENGKVVAYKVNGENVSLGRSQRNGTTE